ncbi:glycosyltransferase family 8 protein [Vagococcus carniphilus]|uniref:Glycosyl transferase n=1 Tax=Vagococcus carniphilus TaxID=218144 RepID=A0A430B0D0_9ENTE|nr:glycosyltransferase family 8 protein [Vagococcus carniphilus]QNN73025.1 glycosyltransferase family 8 protein [Vagococcus carniphilus]RSU13672.1 glycosyl transferase [Vagococcus carniphilus]
MKNNEMHILVTVDENYLKPLEVMLYSMYQHHQKHKVVVWLIHEKITEKQLAPLRKLLGKFKWDLEAIKIEDDFFEGAPTVERYPKEMYFRLLCGDILPKDLHRVLYLDPDLLVINSLLPLWQMDLEGSLLAAATHTGVTNITTGLNNLRLNTDHNYYNSGVMLIDLDVARDKINLKDIGETIEKYASLLLLPDQDVLNHLYGHYIKEIPDEIWNYDARKYISYLTRSVGKYDLHWLMENTAILHFCGKPKPWQAKSDTKFTALYLDYARQMDYL